MSLRELYTIIHNQVKLITTHKQICLSGIEVYEPQHEISNNVV